MTTGLYGQHLTLMETIKAATFTAHAQLQTAPYFGALASCQLPLESYVGQLRALAVIHGVLEPILSRGSDARLAAVWSHDMGKLSALQRDLRFFEPRTVPDLREAVEAALKIDQHIRLRSLDEPLALLGYLYVLEGSMLGANVVRPLVARALLLEGQDGLAYLHGYGAEGPAQWGRFLQGMNALELNPEERAVVVAAAGEFFGELSALFHRLYPFAPESKTFLVTSINPEAGRHPVPADAREVEASLRAGDVCWQNFPYFEQRYGERGRRFARSDAAWQATLYQYEPPQILQQVRWLGRVLAGRGMPTLLLEDQLEVLVTELSAAIPENTAAYARLLPATAALHAARSQHLTDDQIDTLADEFDRAVGPEWRTRLPHTGRLLGAAVADELAGCPGAVKSLHAWMSDADRFPPVWIQAVETALHTARDMAEQTATLDSAAP